MRLDAKMVTAALVAVIAVLVAGAGLWIFQDSATARNKLDLSKHDLNKLDLNKLGLNNPTQLASVNLGSSGLPVPRFVSLKRDKVNVRRGPSTSHKVAWVFTSKGYPVEVIAELDHWRRIRDSEGEEGWIYHSLLSGWRTGVISPWREDVHVTLLKDPGAQSTGVARLEAGVLSRIRRCTGQWCEIGVSGFRGWVSQDKLWGVYPGEQIK